MQISPHNKREWLNFFLLPFKAYTIIWPLFFFFTMNVEVAHHVYGVDMEGKGEWLGLGFLFCWGFLLVAALKFALDGKKDLAINCLICGIIPIVIFLMFMSSLARA